jgi:hypothetical protein
MRVTTWSLEMREAPPGKPLPAPRGAELRWIVRPPLHFYRYLYETAGRDWLWVDRRRLDDGQLLAIVHDPRVEIAVAYVDGVPGGYAELDRRVEGEVELTYFGLFPEQIGRWLLDAAIRRAWTVDVAPSRLWVHTCSLDHHAARRTYERAGLVLFDQRDDDVEDPRPLPYRPR